MIEAAVFALLGWLALPRNGLTTVFVVALISATLLPMGSEPLVFAVIKANHQLFWTVILVATVGNTLGGAIDYAMGYAAKDTFTKEQERFWFAWLKRFGAKAMLLSWLPVIGDPLCTLGGWLRLPFWSSLMYMAIGKFLRYCCITWLLLELPDGFWRNLASLFT